MTDDIDGHKENIDFQRYIYDITGIEKDSEATLD